MTVRREPLRDRRTPPRDSGQLRRPKLSEQPASRAPGGRPTSHHAPGGHPCRRTVSPDSSELREQYTDPTQLEEAASIAVDRHGAAMERVSTEAGTADLTASQQRAWDAHGAALAELREFLVEQRTARLQASRSQYGAQFTPGGPPAPGSGLSEARQRALRLVDDEVRTRGLDTAAGDRMHTLIRADSDDVVRRGDRRSARCSRWNPHYRTAFSPS